MKKPAVVFILMFFLVTYFYGADAYIRQVVKNKAFILEGQEHEAREEIIETWISKNRLAKNGQGRSLIVLLDKKIIVTVSRKKNCA